MIIMIIKIIMMIMMSGCRIWFWVARVWPNEGNLVSTASCQIATTLPGCQIFSASSVHHYHLQDGTDAHHCNPNFSSTNIYLGGYQVMEYKIIVIVSQIVQTGIVQLSSLSFNLNSTERNDSAHHLTSSTHDPVGSGHQSKLWGLGKGKEG